MLHLINLSDIDGYYVTVEVSPTALATKQMSSFNAFPMAFNATKANELL